MAGKESPSLKQYAGFAFQLVTALGLSVYGGWHLDKWLAWRFLLFIWSLPLLVLILLLVKVVRDTSKK